MVSMMPPTRRPYSLRHAQLPKSPTDVRSGSPSCTPCRRCRRTASTTTFGRSSFTWRRISSNQLKTSGRVRPVATRPSTVPDRLHRGARARGAHDRVAGRGSPASPPRSRSEASASARTPASAAAWVWRTSASSSWRVGIVVAGVVGRPPSSEEPPDPCRCRRCHLPTAAWTPWRGRSSRSAWLTPASGPVRASATSRCHPAGLL